MCSSGYMRSAAANTRSTSRGSPRVKRSRPRDHIDPAYRERAPHIVRHDGMGDIYIVDGMKTPVPMGLQRV